MGKLTSSSVWTRAFQPVRTHLCICVANFRSRVRILASCVKTISFLAQAGFAEVRRKLEVILGMSKCAVCAVLALSSQKMTAYFGLEQLPLHCVELETGVAILRPKSRHRNGVHRRSAITSPRRSILKSRRDCHAIFRSLGLHFKTQNTH